MGKFSGSFANGRKPSSLTGLARRVVIVALAFLFSLSLVVGFDKAFAAGEETNLDDVTSNVGSEQVYPEDERELVFDYRGGDERFVAEMQDLIGADEIIVPGDVISGVVRVSNSSGVASEFFLGFEFLDDELLNGGLASMEVVVQGAGDDALFEGTLADAAEARDVSLGEIGSGDETFFSWSIRMPEELDNSIAGMLGSFDIVVHVQEHPEDPEEPDDAGLASEKIDDDPLPETALEMVVAALGDNVMTVVTILCAAAMGLIVLLVARRKSR